MAGNTYMRLCCIYRVDTVSALSYSTIVLYNRDYKGVGVAHKITSPNNQPQFFPDDDEVR